MIPWLKRFLFDETAFKRLGRGLLLAAGSLWAIYQVDGQLTWRTALSGLAAFLAGAIGVGEPNPRGPDR